MQRMLIVMILCLVGLVGSVQAQQGPDLLAQCQQAANKLQGHLALAIDDGAREAVKAARLQAEVEQLKKQVEQLTNKPKETN